MIGRNSFSVALFLFLCIAVSESKSWAYIPPAGFLMKSLARKHAGYKRIRVKSEVIALGSDGQPTGVRFKEQLTYLPASGTLRSSALDETGASLFEVTRQDPSLSAAALLLFESRSAHLVEYLKSLGIPIPTESELAALPNEDERHAAESEHLARLGHSIAWLIEKSTQPSERESSAPASSRLWPQLWIEKDTFLPLRLVAALGKGENTLNDVRYDGFRTYSEFPYPKTVVLLASDGTPRLRVETVDVLMDGAAEKKMPELSAEAWTAAGEAAAHPLRDLIRDFYSVLR
jgi:hypothetical protein